MLLTFDSPFNAYQSGGDGSLEEEELVSFMFPGNGSQYGDGEYSIVGVCFTDLLLKSAVRLSLLNCYRVIDMVLYVVIVYVFCRCGRR